MVERVTGLEHCNWVLQTFQKKYTGKEMLGPCSLSLGRDKLWRAASTRQEQVQSLQMTTKAKTKNGHFVVGIYYRLPD